MRQYRNQRENASPTGPSPPNPWLSNENKTESVARTTDTSRIQSSAQLDAYKPEVVSKAIDPILIEFSTEKPVSESKHSDSEHVIANDDT